MGSGRVVRVLVTGGIPVSGSFLILGQQKMSRVSQCIRYSSFVRRIYMSILIFILFGGIFMSDKKQLIKSVFVGVLTSCLLYTSTSPFVRITVRACREDRT